jgi:hypothetical protein
MQEQEPWTRAAVAQVDGDLWVTGLELNVREAFKHVCASYCVDEPRPCIIQEVWPNVFVLK